ncbi:MAG: hypothetical protein ACRDQ5_12435 [Sciscionella sp.]
MDQENRRIWTANPDATFARRLGISPYEPGDNGGTRTQKAGGCPDIWELSNGDFAVIGRDLTAAYQSKLPGDVSVRSDERLVVVPREMIIAAKVDIPDA